MADVVEGADFSSCQGTKIDWRAYFASGRQFAILKATEGATGVDPSMAIDRAAAEAAGVVVGEYEFAHPTSLDAAKEVANFWAHLGDKMPARVFLDVETPQAIAGHEREVVKFIEDWCAEWATYSAQPPVLYSYLSYLEQLAPYIGPASVIRTLDIWLAWYGKNLPKMPACYGRVVMVQYSGNNSAPIPGVPAVVDHDRFLGSFADFLAWCGFPSAAGAA